MTTTINTSHSSALYRTMWRSVMREVGSGELADRIMERIVDSHPHLSQVWEENTCRCCKAILTPLNRSEGSAFCDFCHMDMDRDEFYDRNIKMYGAE